ncbi:methylated-DNA--[protein]-cysteine S-methyltransferase [Pseudomonas cavernae]|uniref:Methylated-DNA--protein-cysteine methyltransferase n=1 Tax=Pseudomonas cavernae TaxID=2320867 RepID=A0A385Z3Z3_9PSED|nr:methylated-DNA--[protein]-cysteine S-methyltransferase [Pseudomonas cavernae]AYC33260.1 methylated-DNA--[protein]-cysteine S-methyltransferase [Pseudomonas cavernae]
MHYRYHHSPLGPLLIAGDEQGLRLLHMDAAQPWELAADWHPDQGELNEACRQLDQYFAGRRQTFELQLAPVGTAFQRQVWQALQEIPYGRTWSYAELARHIAKPEAVRAVGTANGANPLAVVIPCHRVIGSNGTLTGYAGGLERKRLLLQLEGALLL